MYFNLINKFIITKMTIRIIWAVELETAEIIKAILWACYSNKTNVRVIEYFPKKF